MDINGYDEFGRTPLMNAAIEGDIDEVRRLLDLGADPDKTDESWGTTKAADFAARLASKSDVHREIYELLVSACFNNEADMQDVREEDAYSAVADTHSLAIFQPPLWCKAAAFIERLAIRAFRLIVAAAIGGIAIWLLNIAVDTLSKPFASLSPITLIGGILAGITGLLILIAALLVAFGAKGDSRIEMAWRERQGNAVGVKGQH